MKQVKVKIFSSENIDDDKSTYYQKLGIPSYSLYEYENQIVNKQGYVKPKYSKQALKLIKPLQEDIKEVTKYELDEDEKIFYSMLKNNIKQLEKILDSNKRKLDLFERSLLSKINKDSLLYEGEHWDCNLSPFGKCVYEFDGCEYKCIFCGEPEERK